jgi:hypothetical protein
MGPTHVTGAQSEEGNVCHKMSGIHYGGAKHPQNSKEHPARDTLIALIMHKRERKFTVTVMIKYYFGTSPRP